MKGSTTSEIKIQELESLGIESYCIDITEFEEFDLFLASDILLIAITLKDIDAYERFIEQIEISSIQKVIFISSTSVYPASNSIVTEETETMNTPLSEIENLFKNNTFFETTIIRFAGLFGPDEIIDQNCWNTTFNASSNDHPTRKDFYINARNSLNFEMPIFEENSQLNYKIISSKKLQENLNYQFIHDNLLEI